MNREVTRPGGPSLKKQVGEFKSSLRGVSPELAKEFNTVVGPMLVDAGGGLERTGLQERLSGLFSPGPKTEKLNPIRTVEAFAQRLGREAPQLYDTFVQTIGPGPVDAGQTIQGTGMIDRFHALFEKLPELREVGSRK